TEAPATEAPATEAPVSWKACVAFDTGGLGDKGFNDLAKKGLEDAAAAGFDTAFAEAQGATDYASNIQRLIDQGCQSIVAVGFQQGQAVADATLANPDIAFGHVDATWNPCGADFTCGTADDPPPGVPANFTGLDFQIDEAATLAGYLAAGFSQTGKIGTYGGAQFPGVTRFMDGMYAGIGYYNEQKGTSVELLGWDGNATGTFVGGNNPWNDPAKGEQLAQTFLDQGVDIVHPVSGATGNGTIKAMLAAGKWAIGVDTDQAISLAEYSKAILTSAEKVIDVAVLEMFKKNAAGDLGGEDFVGTLANAGVRLSPFHDLDASISAELKAEIQALNDAIASGSIKVCTYLARGC
ncbi:MAG TPA: BMP family ABC transporter substrate-binding protein, partial [Candidatus Sulfomarinibacteraceae bacterium]|nr:BMP family ABC transporter substrate-binding protein [Candidatus Sulfomarinibacteraceae bacterium]